MDLSPYIHYSSGGHFVRSTDKIVIKMKIKEFFTGFWKGQKLFGETISSLINFLLLSIIYFIGIGLTFIISKIFKKEFLSTQIDENSETYWENLNLNKKPLEEYYRQF